MTLICSGIFAAVKCWSRCPKVAAFQVQKYVFLFPYNWSPKLNFCTTWIALLEHPETDHMKILHFSTH